MPDNSVDSVVCDPPYELGFMGKGWDKSGIANNPVMWAEALRVLKPGGHLLAFSGSRTYHRMACAIEDAGFEVRDQIMWVYGSGFPKSLDVSKAIDKSGGGANMHLQARIELAKEIRAKREGKAISRSELSSWFPEYSAVTANWERTDDGFRVPTEAAYSILVSRLGIVDGWRDMVRAEDLRRIVSSGGTDRREDGTVYGLAHSGIEYAATTEAARQWQGWGTALKPSFEPVCFARKPNTEKAEQDIIRTSLLTLSSKLWSISLVNAARQYSASNQQELSAALAIAQWSAESAISTQGVLSEAMGMSQLELATNTSLSIVSSWRNTLEEVLAHESMCTIETKSSQTTDWKTLNYCLSKITPSTIIQGVSLRFGQPAFASTAERYFDAELKRLTATLELSALASAISQDRQSSLDVDDKVKHEPICVARKPLVGTVAANVLQHGTGALNIDGCRVEVDGGRPLRLLDAKDTNNSTYAGRMDGGSLAGGSKAAGSTDLGRWPANLITDGSDEVVALFPDSNGSGPARNLKRGKRDGEGWGMADESGELRDAGTGSAARFFYCSKASRKDRNEGLTDPGPQFRHGATLRQVENTATTGNTHPTVKPTDLMAYLCRLVTPPGGTVLDPFMGSGSTGKAAMREGFQFIGIDITPEYHAIAQARIEHELAKREAAAAVKAEADAQPQQLSLLG